jgi:hypothetical protein
MDGVNQDDMYCKRMDDLFNVNDAEHVKFGYKLDMKYKSLNLSLFCRSTLQIRFRNLAIFTF